MNQVTDRGVLSHDIKEKNDENKIDCSTECSDVSHGIEVNTQSIVKLYAETVKEKFDSGNDSYTSTQKEEVISANDEVVVEESVNTYQKRKKLKISEISNNDEVESNENCDDTKMPALTQVEMENDEVTINRNPCDTNMLANNPSGEVDNEANKNCDANMLALLQPEMQNDTGILADNPMGEVDDEASKTVGIVEAEELEEKSHVDALSKDSVQQPQPEQQSDDNISFEQEQLDDDIEIVNEGIDVAVKVVNEGIDVSVDKNIEIVNEGIDVPVDIPIAVNAVRKLLVLDLNGLLLHISSYVPYHHDPHDIIMRKAVFRRPYCDDFLEFCFERFNVGVWTSRTKTNMEPIIDFLFGNDRNRLLFCWDQSHCTDTGFIDVEFRYKPLLLKKLKKLWDKSDPDLPWEKGVYNETNTLLLDDSPPKSICNPLYNAVFPYSYEFHMTSDDSLGPNGDMRKYLEGLALAENVPDYVRQNPFGQRPVTEKNLSWGYYHKVIEACSTPPRETEEDDAWR